MKAPDVRPLGDALRMNIDAHAVTSEKTYRIAGVRGFGNGVFAREQITGGQTSYKTLHRMTGGQFVMSRLKAFEGAIALVPDEFDGYFASPEFPTFSLREGVGESRYVKHLFGWPAFWDMLKGESKGIGARRERVSAERLLALRVPLPHVDEQRRIADKLDAAMEKCMTVQTLRSHASSVRVSLQESMIHEALEHSTETVRMGDIVTLKRDEINVLPEAIYRPIGMRGFGRGMIRYDSTPGSQLGKLRFYRFPNSALVLSNIKAWEGAIGMTSENEEEFVASNRFLFYVPKDGRVNISYLRHYLLARKGLSQISACSPGAADRNRTLGMKRFENIRFDLPPRDTQDRVASTLDGLNERLSAAHSLPTLQALPPSLLDAAFSGRL
ncbi:hypothetical protein GCM10010343_51370 [Streptomyces avidinii]|nr:hypothetical protein GCM10010343_51370 [Streptomyces avidinii]